MNKNTNIPIGDLSGRETELGVPTRDVVNQRAREIAALNQRNPDEFIDADWEQAQAELTGAQSPNPKTEFDKTTVLQSERNAVVGQQGHEVKAIAPKDEERIDERLAERGVEEAAHDQRVASDRNE